MADQRMKGDRPAYYELLSDMDKATYERIRQAIIAPTNKNKKYKRADDFREIMEAIELYQNHEPNEKWKRCLVCGVFKFDKGIAVKISALKQLIFKCKSSINGSLKAIGYPTVDYKSSMCEELLNGIPYLRGNISELRQWTVRYKVDPKDKDDTQFISPPLETVPESTGFNFSITAEGTEELKQSSWLNYQFDEFEMNIFDNIDL